MSKTKIKNSESVNQYLYGLKENHFILPFKEALIIAGIYGIFGFLWIMLSDEILMTFIKDVNKYKQAQTFKGWFYVIINILLLFYLVLKRSVRIMNALVDLHTTYDELQSTYEELVSIEDELTDQKKFNEKIFMESHVIMGTWDKEGRIIRLNPYGQKVLGYSEEELINQKWSDLFISENNKSNIYNNYDRISHGSQIRNHESQFITKDEKKIDIIWNSSLLNYSNKASEVLSIGADITERKRLEEKLKEAAYYDRLTGLPNRLLFERTVKKLIDRNIEIALVYIDIDNFKQVNDTLGHSAGDKFLTYLADKLQALMRRKGMIARLSGDEFAIVYEECPKEELDTELSKLTEEFKKSWEISGFEFFLTASMGISIFPTDCKDVTTLIKNADVAMYKAKKDGKSRFVFYTDDIMKDNTENIMLANQLKHALVNKELILYYQPQYSLESGKITGLEVLVRWIHEGRFIPPSKFIPIAEDTGQIYELEYWIIESAIQQKKTFENMGNYDITISINLSSKSLCSDTGFRNLEELFMSYEVDYSHVIIEITETAIISDVDFAVKQLNKLRKLGMKVALDDFGTGFSSLIHLKELPIDLVKLDRSFIQSIEEDSKDAAGSQTEEKALSSKDAMIIKAILYLALDLNYEVVAEGIETTSQLEFLKKYKCRTGQGYLLSKPVPIENVPFG